jgi:hypothetical protein
MVFLPNSSIGKMNKINSLPQWNSWNYKLREQVHQNSCRIWRLAFCCAPQSDFCCQHETLGAGLLPAEAQSDT